MKRTYTILGALIGWFAVIAQLYLIIENRKASVFNAVINFFSYFTILTNILCAVCFTSLLRPESKSGKFFSKAKTLTAITVYITIVGLVYNIILRFIWQPTGLQLVVDELLHSVIPVMFILYWFIYAPKEGLEYKGVWRWLMYPVVYVVLIITLGAFRGFYPYPFLEVNVLGYSKVFINVCILIVIFLLFSLMYTAIGRMLNKQRQV